MKVAQNQSGLSINMEFRNYNITCKWPSGNLHQEMLCRSSLSQTGRTQLLVWKDQLFLSLQFVSRTGPPGVWPIYECVVLL